ncbi:uncharacterized protein ACN63O_017707 [Diretmus argenteus]
MSGPRDVTGEPDEELESSPLVSSDPLGKKGIEEKIKGEESKEEEDSAVSEPSTLLWPGDKEKTKGISAENGVFEDEEGDGGPSGGSQDPPGDRSDRERKAKWRESMPEGDRWRDDDVGEDKGDGSLADDEEEKEEEDRVNWMPEKAALVFTPQVKIVHPYGKELHRESRRNVQEDAEKETDRASAVQYYPHYLEDEEDRYSSVCDHVCGERLRLILGMAAAAVLFPLLVWGGYVLLPFDAPLLESAPLRLVYTLRCSFFAVVPILLGVVVQGVARLRYSVMAPLYRGNLESREVAVHWHFVHESLALFLFFFLQLAVMATYIDQDLLKLVPLLSIVFVFGRLIYWVCLSLGSSVRALGFGLSFLPVLAMLGANLYYVCSSLGEGAVFDVAPPTTAPPPRQRFWG